MIGWIGLFLAGICVSFALGRASVRSGRATQAGPELQTGVAAFRGSLPAVKQPAAPSAPTSKEARTNRVREDLRGLRLSHDNRLRGMCGLARWLDQANAEDLRMALSEGDSVLGQRSQFAEGLCGPLADHLRRLDEPIVRAVAARLSGVDDA